MCVVMVSSPSYLSLSLSPSLWRLAPRTWEGQPVHPRSCRQSSQTSNHQRTNLTELVFYHPPPSDNGVLVPPVIMEHLCSSVCTLQSVHHAFTITVAHISLKIIHCSWMITSSTVYTGHPDQCLATLVKHVAAGHLYRISPTGISSIL